MANVQSYTYDALMAMITPFYERLQSQAAEIAANDKRISSLAAQVRAIPAGAARDAAQAKLELLSRPQAQIRLDRRAFAAKWNKAIGDLNAWAAKAGVTTIGPPMLLSGLGIAPIIVAGGIALAIVAIVSGTYLITEHNKNVAITKGAATLQSILGDATTSPAQKVALMAAYDKAIKEAADAAGKGDIADTIKSLALPLALVAAIVVLPKLLPARRGAA